MCSKKKNYINVALHDFKTVTSSPETFLSEQTENAKQIKCFLKETYDFTKGFEEKINSNALPELITEDFDLEQIWQQLELQNDGFLIRSLTNVSKLLVLKDKLIFNEVRTENDNLESDHEQSLSESDDDDEDSNDDEPLQLGDDSDGSSINSDILSNDDTKIENRPVKKSIVDDDFFKLNEMEAFLLAEEKKLNDKEPDSGNDSESLDEEEDENNDDNIDFFNENEDSDDLENDEKEGGKLKNPRYKDFFAESVNNSKTEKRNKFLEDIEMDEDKEDLEPEFKSSLELRQERLKRKIGYLEEAAISEKPWQLKGEITANSRPQNSLLEEIVDFDLTTRPAPVMTEQTSMFLEDVIKQRIKEQVFDSVERKQKPVETPLEYKKKLVLNQEKSKESLAQIYEQEYLKQKEALDPNAADKDEEEPKEHVEIRKMMTTLFRQLDALSNFHFTPRMQVPELKIVSNLPAINMEEVAPVAASDAALLAPEEVKGKVRGQIIGKSERTDTDKNRERRKKKQKQRVHANEKRKVETTVNKLNPGLGNKYSKEKAKKLLQQVTKDRNVDKMDESLGSKSVKSSTAFFSQLQDEVKSQIKTKAKLKQNANNNKNVNAKKMKL